MAKKNQRREAVSFEEALAKLEEIVRQLEDGQLGLSESLARYEEGVRHLKQCHAALQEAEQKIVQLTSVDEHGQAATKPLEAESVSLEEKQQSRSRRRSEKTSDPEQEADVDTQKGLF